MNDIEQALHALGTRLRAEPARDLSTAIEARLAAPRRARVQRWQALTITFATLLLASATALATSPALRDHARSWLRSVGISTSVSEHATKAPLVGLDRAGLGAPVAAGNAAKRLGLRALPRPFGEPLEVFAANSVVTIAWAPGADRPPSAVRSVGALLTISRRAGIDDERWVLAKTLSARTTVEFVPLAGAERGQALWLAGAPHAVTLIQGRTLRFRLAANVLIWQAGVLVYRLEGRFSREVAVATAQQVIG